MHDRPSVSLVFLEPGEIISERYRIKRLIGTGGMAAVYLAKDLSQPSKLLALKMLHKEFSRDKNYVERFVREAKLMHHVSDPNVVKTFDIGADGSDIYFTMEYVSGENLAERLEDGFLNVGEIARIAKQIITGLEAIHCEGIVHRDVKPGNVLISTSGDVKIGDFGIARENSSHLTTDTQRLGSLAYIAPDIWTGAKPTLAIDFYSLGIMLYEMATGEVPFEAAYPGEMMNLHLSSSATPPQEKNSELPDELNQLILGLLEKKVEDRIVDHRKVIEVLEPFIDTPQSEFKARPKPRTVSQRQSASSKNGKTYVFEMTATKILDEAGISAAPKRRRATMVIPLPGNSACVFHIEPPSRDFIYLGIFFASLQVCDGFLTSLGMQRFSIAAEGNIILRSLMHRFGPDETLLVTKGIAIFLVAGMTVAAKRAKWVKDMIGLLSCIYLTFAIIPWICIFVMNGLPV